MNADDKMRTRWMSDLSDARGLRLAAFLGCALLSLAPRDALGAAPVRPNVIMLLIDDMGWGDFSCFGNIAAKTPHIDRLAAEGLRFEQFYVALSICSPSRAGLSTGQYPQRWRIGSFLNTRAENDARGIAQWLDPRAPMLARLLHEAGYATGHFGKWHMGGQRDVGDAPLITEYGFDESLTNFEGLGPRVLPLLDAHDGKPARKYALGSDLLGRGEITWQDRAEVTATYASAALAFIKKSSAAKKPFYVNLWPDDVHSPFFPRAALRGDAAKRTLYHAVLATMDAQLGVLFDAIRADPALRDNTLIVVCSDNGPEPGAGSAGNFRGSKGMLYEGGVRSPLIVWGPGFTNPKKTGAVNRTSHFSTIDLAPTLLEIAGVSAPVGVAFDGASMRETLLGRSEASRAAPLFFRRPPDCASLAGIAKLPDLAVRDGRWKLLCVYDGSAAQLYDLVADPAEAHDVAGQQPVETARLSTAVVAWHREMPADRGATYRAPARPGVSSR